MAANTITYAGFSDSKMRLSNRTYFTEPNGLERIEDNYILKTSMLPSFQAQAVLGTKNSEMMSLCTDSATSYDKMTIERVDYMNIGGDLTSARVTYVGLHSTANPRPLISITPILNQDYVYNTWMVSAEFVTFLGESGSSQEINAAKSKFSGANGKNPGAINGYKIPDSPYPPIEVSSENFATYKINTGWLSCPRLGVQGSEDIGGSGACNTSYVYGKLSYYGMCVSSFEFVRYGLYAVVYITWRDTAYYIIGQAVYACGEAPFTQGICRGSLNYPLPDLGTYY
ncbi:MAG: hypothetical protein EB127_04515 [Alphaproteobacteria bacterium]|nr:hypothetical protein [Alphaproteobacteria bacterium]